MPTEVVMPQLGQSVAEGTVVQWLVRAGERVEKEQPLVAVSTDKVDVEIPSPAAGIVRDILVREGETVPVMTVLAVIKADGAPLAARPEPRPGLTEPEAGAVPAGEAPAGSYSPAVRRLADKHGIDLSRVKGTGAGGRVTRRDVEAFIERLRVDEAARAPAPAGDRPPAAAGRAPAEARRERDVWGPVERVPFTPMRRRIAEHMVLSRRTSAHVTTFVEVDVTNLVRFREANRESFERREGIPLNYTPFFVQAAVSGLRAFPVLNASVEEGAVVLKHYVNVGVAVAVPDGLIVPVIKNAHEKSFSRLAREVHDLAGRAREKTLTPEDVQGGTFTITNPGVFGTIFSTPIINQPQVAILDVEAIRKRPVVVEGPNGDAIAVRSMLNLGLSFDHRVIDGATGAMFLAHLKRWLEATSFQM